MTVANDCLCGDCQHALLLPVLVQHLLFHKCLDVLEETIDYKFQDRLLLQVLTVSVCASLMQFASLLSFSAVCVRHQLQSTCAVFYFIVRLS